MEKQFTEEALAKVLHWAESAESFVSDQAPLLAEEIIVRGQVAYTIGAVVIYSLVILFLFLTYKTGRRFFIDRSEDAQIASSVSTAVFIVVSIIARFVTIDLITVFTAPRLYVIQELQG